MESSVNLLCEENNCCGCSACFAICPVKAIEMVMDDKGFKYPVINYEKCIECGKCRNVCAFRDDLKGKKLKENACEIYAAKNMDEKVLFKSSSGGVFTALSDWMFLNSGAVISAIYDAEQKKVKYCLYDDRTTRDLARGSKYIQADMEDVFLQGYEWLKKNSKKSLMFVGTGCQAAGFLKYANSMKVRDRVIIVDLICHGAPSPGLWDKYARYIEKKHKGFISNISFKDKRKGWTNPTVYAKVNNKEVSIKGYSAWFYENYSIRQSCYQCPYTKIKRDSDITIGDFWGVEQRYPEFYDPKGVSLVILQSERGKKVFDEIKPQLELIKIKEEECLQPRLEEPACKPQKYELFWKDISDRGIGYCERRYKQVNVNSICYRAIRKVLRIIRRFLL